MSVERVVFYRLVTAGGLAYADSDIDFVKCSPEIKLLFFADIVHSRNSSILSSYAVSQLKLHRFTESLNVGHEVALDKKSPLGDGHGNSLDQPLLVLVPVHSLSPQVINPVSDAQLSQRLRWLPEPEKTYSIKDQEMLFVNRDDAIEKLVNIHASTFTLGRKKGAGTEFQIALIDNIVGTGKTTFAENYISKAGPVAKECRAKCADSLSRARTVIVRLKLYSMWQCVENSVRMDDAIRDQFVVTLNDMIQMDQLAGTTGFLCENLDSLSSLEQAIRRFIVETKTPLFLVFDEVGSACENNSPTTLIDQRNVFFDFCTILSSFLGIPNFYVLLTGKADFLSLVANRTPCSPSVSGSTVNITRIGLNLIRRDKIGKILDETFTDMPEPGIVSTEKQFNSRTLSDLYSIAEKTDPRRQQAINAILAATNGHPRSMLHMFDECKTFESLLTSEPAGAVSNKKKFEDWAGQLLEYSEGVQILMDRVEDGQTVDLGGFVFPHLSKSITYAQLADMARLRYEGTTGAAKLFASKLVKRQLAVFFLPLRSFLMQMDTSTDLQYAHERNFELCVLRRFQEMFGGALNDISRFPPGEGYPHLFGGTLFGSLQGFFLNRALNKIPKISDGGLKIFTMLDQKTADPKLWPQILQAMRSQSLPRNFLPADLSASTDVFLVTKAKLEDVERTVTIGLAVKCIQSPLALDGEKNSVGREREIFNRMFEPGDQVLANSIPNDRSPVPDSADLGKDLNVLIVCSSGGYAGTVIVKDKNFVKFEKSSKFPHIDETILLDLSSAEKRANFFGVSDDRALADKVEWMVKKGTLETT